MRLPSASRVTLAACRARRAFPVFVVAPAPPASGDGERPDVVAVRRVEQDGGFGLGLRGGKRRPVARDAYAVERVELVEHAPPEPIGDIRPFVQLGRNIEVAALAFDIHRFGIGAVASFFLAALGGILAGTERRCGRHAAQQQQAGNAFQMFHRCVFVGKRCIRARPGCIACIPGYPMPGPLTCG